MAVERPVIYLVDDDDIVLWTYHELLRGLGTEIRTFVSARDFVESYRPAPVECLVCDLRMPGMCGLQVQSQLAGKGLLPPTIFVSAYSEVPSVVKAIKAGALDFLEKPVDGAMLVQKVRGALERSRQMHEQRLASADKSIRLALLTPKERLVAWHVTTGKTSKAIATELGISVRTVENHRAHLMEKLQVRSAIELTTLLLD
ncbi:response regulator transcription factor [Cupriavidus basilensis]|uniref:response regulator transcription factor n=1 Tax=Cupriavidus basilensis TaxID=68895 RepID=UPI0005B86D2E|nr:response regulator [Cupriavidus basilensis]